MFDNYYYKVHASFLASIKVGQGEYSLLQPVPPSQDEIQPEVNNKESRVIIIMIGDHYIETIYGCLQ